jgi:hypothetical protein
MTGEGSGFGFIQPYPYVSQNEVIVSLLITISVQRCTVLPKLGYPKPFIIAKFNSSSLKKDVHVGDVASKGYQHFDCESGCGYFALVHACLRKVRYRIVNRRILLFPLLTVLIPVNADPLFQLINFIAGK